MKTFRLFSNETGGHHAFFLLYDIKSCYSYSSVKIAAKVTSFYEYTKTTFQKQNSE